jgi:hypothetical protein
MDFFLISKTRFNFRFYLQRFSSIIRENKGTAARDEMDFDHHLILPGTTKKDLKIFLFFKIRWEGLGFIKLVYLESVHNAFL